MFILSSQGSEIIKIEKEKIFSVLKNTRSLKSDEIAGIGIGCIYNALANK